MKEFKTVEVPGHFKIGNKLPFVLIAGSCAIEGRDHALFMARNLKEICEGLEINFIYKSSFTKANRTALGNTRGVGMEEGLEILQEIRETLKIPVVTDVHEAWQCERAAKMVDILQIPARLCRQTDLLIEAGKTGKVVHVKKGQDIHPEDMKYTAEKVLSTGNDKILLADRGSAFGFRNLICDPTYFVKLAQLGFPVVMDATHAVQTTSGQGSCSGGDRKMVEYYARAAVSTGVCSTLYMECHDRPEEAHCDGPNSIRLSEMRDLLLCLKALDQVSKVYNNSFPFLQD